MQQLPHLCPPIQLRLLLLPLPLVQAPPLLLSPLEGVGGQLNGGLAKLGSPLGTAGQLLGCKAAVEGVVGKLVGGIDTLGVQGNLCIAQEGT